MEKPKYAENQSKKQMPTKKQLQTQLDELTETIIDTLTLLETLQQQAETPKGIDYTTIRQLDWHLGWHNNIYHLEITEHPHYDTQALNLAAKILRQILETQEPPQ